MRESAKFLATSAQTCPDARWHWNIHCSCRNLLCSCRNLFFNFIAGRVHHQNRKKKQQTIDFGNLETSVHELINSFKSFILGMIEWVRCYLVFILKKKKTCFIYNVVRGVLQMMLVISINIQQSPTYKLFSEYNILNRRLIFSTYPIICIKEVNTR